MIAYICKYAPIEILEACGAPMVIMEPHVANFNQADALMHPNICSYVKAVLEEFEKGSYEGMLFTTCCDSSRRLYDTLCSRHPDKFFFCLDLPRKVNEFAVSLYVKQIEQLIKEYEAFSGKTFDVRRLAEICAQEFEMQERKQELEKREAGAKKTDLNVCLAGARPGSEIKQLIRDLGADITLDLTCTGITREYKIDETNRETILRSYAEGLLGQIPCMRMAQVDDRAQTLLEQADDLDGILYHTVKFCDIYSYEYTRLKQTIDLPVLKIETDATSQCAGQILTRVEAFFESLRAKKKPAAENTNTGESAIFCDTCMDGEYGASIDPRISKEDVAKDMSSPKTTAVSESISDAPSVNTKHKGDQPMYIMGIDSGSTSTNAVIINEKKEILSYAVLRTGAKSAGSAEKIREEVLEKAGIKAEDLSMVISTGYGRVSIPFADKNVTEISCHAKGAHFINPAVRTILDIGGQDSKAIHINGSGDVIDFVMNDKCAAGTGRFLEMMADTLEVDISELGPLSLKSKENVEISSMCTVFAESEVISLIAQNKEPADIARGLHRAIAGKAVSLLRKVNPEPEFMMTGGVAKNPGVVKALEEMMDAPFYIYEEPEIVGALGAALYGLKN